jgi:hypothetical protein
MSLTYIITQEDWQGKTHRVIGDNLLMRRASMTLGACAVRLASAQRLTACSRPYPLDQHGFVRKTSERCQALFTTFYHFSNARATHIAQAISGNAVIPRLPPSTCFEASHTPGDHTYCLFTTFCFFSSLVFPFCWGGDLHVYCLRDGAPPWGFLSVALCISRYAQALFTTFVIS